MLRAAPARPEPSRGPGAAQASPTAAYMNWTLNKDALRKAGLLVALAAVITVMIAPELDLVSARYERGDVITETVIVSDDVTLVDERSTEARREEALADFPPIYDYDPRLKTRTIQGVRAAFDDMRERIAALRRRLAEAHSQLRRNSLARVETAAALETAEQRHGLLEREHEHVLADIARLGTLEQPDPREAQRLEKRRFDLAAVEAQLRSARREISQLRSRSEQQSAEAERLQGELEEAQAAQAQARENLKQAFEEQLNIGLEASTFDVLFNARFAEDLEEQLVTLLRPVLDHRIVASLDAFPTEREAIQVQTLETERLQRFEALERIADVEQVREEIAQAAADLTFAGDSAENRDAVVALAQRLVRPNLTENKGATERLRSELLENLSPVYFRLEKGDVVARAGDVATAQQVEIIHALREYRQANPRYPQMIGSFLVVLLALGLSYVLLSNRLPARDLTFRRMVLMAVLLLVTLLLAQLVLLVVPALSTVYAQVPPATYHYVIPAALTTMLASIVLRFEIAVFLGFVVSVCLAILLGNSLPFFLYAMLGSLVGAIPLHHYESRYALWQQGLRISAVNVVSLGVLTLLEQGAFNGWQPLAMNAGAAVVNGLLAAFFTATLLPLIEKAFDLTTNLRLLELSNMNHPALKELSVRAPGTYHHSIVVGNLSESAAIGIRANPLMVRVASYYHDLGKMLCPLYFVENQGKSNYHDDLPAKTSARIIINHVKDGLEIARRHKLGRAITDIIAQHHGNSLVRYFYHKAQQESAEMDEAEPVSEADFRYPGPRPQSKEAGLVMVADVTEAATRSLNDPSPESIRDMVQRLTTRVYMEGQLDESGMTFNDLNFIEKSFTKMLISIHHHRISYPEMQVARPNEEAGEPRYEPASRRDLVGERRASGE